MSLFYGEWQKIAGNRMAVAFFVWIFPIGITVFSLLAIVIALFSEQYRIEQANIGIYPWHQTMLVTWQYSNNVFGRVIILFFTAFVFASEYRHGTWKNLVTRRTRVRLIVNKFIVTSAFVTVSLVATTILAAIWSGVLAAVIGVDYGLGDSGVNLGGFARDYAIQAFTTLTGVFIMSGFAALGAMIGKNVVTSAAFGFFFFMIESAGVIFFFGLVDWLFNINLFRLYAFLPTHNFFNIENHIVNGAGVPLSFGEYYYDPNSMALSLVIIGLWSVGVVGAVSYLFRRQDITT